MRQIAMVFCIFVSLVVPLMGVLIAAPANSKLVAAVFPPWWSAAQSFRAAGQAGDIVAVGTVPFAMIVRSDHPDLGDRLRAVGAIVVLNASSAGGCVLSDQRSSHVQ